MSGIIPVQRVRVPVLVVGNITVGGTGKTPLVIWLTRFLKDKGYSPGIISRGYGGQNNRRPQQVRADSNPSLVGDEPVLLAKRTACPVAVARNRYKAASELLNHTDCDILVCDDGLQHMSLYRDIEIAVVDGDRRFGNGFCLPAGPLRESLGQLENVDIIVANARAAKNEFLMEYHSSKFVSVNDESIERDLESFRGQRVHAVAGIGNPQRFYSYLRTLGIDIVKHEFPDHHQFEENDLKYADDEPVIMTEKDAVKCAGYDVKNLWYLKIDVDMSATFEHRLNILIEGLANG